MFVKESNERQKQDGIMEYYTIGVPQQMQSVDEEEAALAGTDEQLILLQLMSVKKLVKHIWSELYVVCLDGRQRLQTAMAGCWN